MKGTIGRLSPQSRKREEKGDKGDLFREQGPAWRGFRGAVQRKKPRGFDLKEEGPAHGEWATRGKEEAPQRRCRS